MHTTLANASWFFFFLIAPGLLVVRAFWPRFLPRWAALILVGTLSGALFYLREWLHQAEMDELVQRFGGFDQTAPLLAEGMVQLQGPRASDFMLGVVSGLAYLLLWLVPYGIVQILRKRSKQSVQPA